MLTVLIGCTLEEPNLCTRHARIQNIFSGGLIGCTLEELSLCTRHARIQNIFSGGVQIPRRGSGGKFQHGKFNNLAILEGDGGGGGLDPLFPPSGSAHARSLKMNALPLSMNYFMKGYLMKICLL